MQMEISFHTLKSNQQSLFKFQFLSTFGERTHQLMITILVIKLNKLKKNHWFLVDSKDYKSHVMRKPAFCMCENKGADQLRSNCKADHRLCFRYTDSTIPLLSQSKISRLWPSDALVQLDSCRTYSETTLLVLP